ncbi:hypothetical protein Cgig2_017487 [Carnegiea gigantea]|uniref:NAC domain-containing protein n=1 Tax=Carnegiea gigantea TaxID=171969 RepID=A0A9Q1KLY7_9CARY|nr:hypothetical protein Cgig2_017487 [Carnegiea gigantea]
MVLYVSTGKGSKPDKTNWAMYQYHLGIEEEEKDGEYIISKQSDKNEEDNADITDDIVVKVDPVTRKSVTPEPPRNERRLEPRKESTLYINSIKVVVVTRNMGNRNSNLYKSKDAHSRHDPETETILESSLTGESRGEDQRRRDDTRTLTAKQKHCRHRWRNPSGRA